MLDNKFKLGQIVRFKSGEELKVGKIVSIRISRICNEIIYEIETESNGRSVNIYERNVNPAINISLNNKEYNHIESGQKVEKLFGKEIFEHFRVLKIEVKGSEVRVHFTKRNEFNPVTITSQCHPDDKFDETKGIIACVLKYNIRIVKESLKNL